MAALQPALSWDFFHHVNETNKLQVFFDIIHPSSHKMRKGVVAYWQLLKLVIQ